MVCIQWVWKLFNPLYNFGTRGLLHSSRLTVSCAIRWMKAYSRSGLSDLTWNRYTRSSSIDITANYYKQGASKLIWRNLAGV